MCVAIVGRRGNGTLTVANGGVVRVGDGTLILADETGSTGRLYIGAGPDAAAAAPGTLEAGAVSFGNGTGQIVFNHTETTYEFAAGITGTGTVDHLAGTTHLTGVSTYTGPTRVLGGTLLVDGELGTSTVSVAGGARLGGTGRIGGDVSVAADGTLAAGSAGTLQVGGDLAFASGSVYEVEVAAGGQSGSVSAAGRVSLEDGAVLVLKPARGLAPFTLHTILRAAGEIEGTFDIAEDRWDLAFLAPSLTYDPNTITLELIPSGVPFTNYARSANQEGAAAGVQSLGLGHPVYDAVVSLKTDEAPVAFDALSGEVYATVRGALVETASMVRHEAAGH